jgi:hypothetical protein
MSSKRVMRGGCPSPSPGFRRFLLVFSASALGALACSTTQKPPRIEDQARQGAPIPACVMPLPPRPAGKTAFVRNLREDQYWELAFPAFDTKNKTLPKGAVPCVGRPVFQDPLFNGGDSAKGWPRPVEDGDIVYGSGGDRIRILWMRTHQFPDGTEAGPLALVRTQEDYAELYAIGAYKGETLKPYFGLERMGSEAVVTAEDDSCVGKDVVLPCENALTVFIPRMGELVALTTLTLEQRAYSLGGEPGAYGRVEYQLTTTPKFVDGGIQVLEQVKAIDEGGRVLRRAELQRMLTLQDAELVQSAPPLWPKIYPKPTAR